jgi:hypothetical protein
VGQKYAGVLGTLACLLAIARGMLAGAGMESTMAAAIASLFGFAAAGWLAGRVAETLVEQSVRTRFEAAMKEMAEK